MLLPNVDQLKDRRAAMGTADGADLDWAGLGQQIRQERRRRGMSQADLATAAGLDRKTISNYENGRVPATAGRVPDGYYSVADVFGWPGDRVDRELGRESRPHRVVTEAAPAGGPSPADLYPGVVAFARACVRAGGDPALRDVLEETAERLLHSVSVGRAPQAGYGLAAYRPHGWEEGDPGVPADDAERIQQALQAYRESRK